MYISKIIGSGLCFFGALSYIIIFFKSFSKVGTHDESKIILFLVSTVGTFVGVIFCNDPETANMIGVFLLLICGVSLLSLIVGAAINSLKGTEYLYLVFIVISGGITSMIDIYAFAMNMPINYSH